MSYTVNFENFGLPPRNDGVPFTSLEIYESDIQNGTYSLIDTQDIDIVSADPADPEPISFTTANATIQYGWYYIRFVADNGDYAESLPIFNSPPIEIMASFDDVNAYLDGEVVKSTPGNSNAIQISVARMIRGYLARTVTPLILSTWTTPDTTPEIIREVAAMLIASRVYANAVSKSTYTEETMSFAQIKYNEAMAILNGIIEGSVTIIGVTETPQDNLTLDDFFPIDSTDRSFTMSQPF